MMPKYNYEDKVIINVTRYVDTIKPTPERGKYESEEVQSGEKRTDTLHGVIYIIDRNGTWDNGNKEPSYDIFVESENTLFKHITESEVYPDDK